MRAAVEQGGAVTITSMPGASWWARGLSLAERLPGVDGPTHTDAAKRRLERWALAHDLAATGQFAARLADAGLDEDALIGLLAEEPAQLACRTTRPSWAVFVERALATPPSPDEARATWQGQFAASLGRFTAAAETAVAEMI